MNARVCRFCGHVEDRLIYYALRSYAHGTCLVDKLPLDRLLRLKTHPLGQLPVAALSAHQYLEAVRTELDRRKA